jgi:hypothetical protein
LKHLAQTCNFHEKERDELIRDVIVFGIGDQRLQERLLRKSDLDLKGGIEACKAAEISKKQAQSMASKPKAI